MATQNEEVKEPLVEVPKDKFDVPVDLDPELDEVITADDLPEDAKLDEEKETPTEASPAEKPADEEIQEKPVTETEIPSSDEPEEVVEPEKKTVKPVEGETPRETALRKEVERVKAQNRKLKGDQLFVEDKPVPAPAAVVDDQDKAVLESVDPEQLSNLEKVIDVIAKKKGWVKQADLVQTNYVETAQAIFSEFMEQNPEFSEEKDPDGVLWNQFKEEYALYQKPKDPRDLKKILLKIKKDIIGVTTDTTGLKKVEAQKEKIKVSSHASGAATTPKPNVKTIDPELAALVNSGAMKGFDDDDLVGAGLK